MSHDLTKSRLIDAAGEEFASKGFEGATIRSIAARAGANIAAVNYHFGDKQKLYEAALLEAHVASKSTVDWEEMDTHPPAERLRLFVRQFLASILQANRARTWHDQLMLRELVEPTAAVETLVRVAIRPQFQWLRETLRVLCPEADERRLSALGFSVVGQCLHYKVCRPISTRLIGEQAFGELDLDYLTDHITTGSLAAIGLGPASRERAEAVSAGGGG